MCSVDKLLSRLGFGLAGLACACILMLALCPGIAFADDETYEELSAQLSSLRSQRDQAAINLERAQNAPSDGAFAFYESRGETEALGIIESCVGARQDISAYTKKGNSRDATSLKHMGMALDLIAECNQLRAQNGLAPLKVNSTMMAIGQVHANYCGATLNHPRAYGTAENIAFSSWDADYQQMDPFEPWYEQEKYNYETGNGGQVLHYFNIISPSYGVTGFGISTYKFDWAGTSCAQEFDFDVSNRAEGAVSLEQYRSEFDAYCSSFADRVTSAQNALDSLDAQIADVQNRLQYAWHSSGTCYWRIFDGVLTIRPQNGTSGVLGANGVAPWADQASLIFKVNFDGWISSENLSGLFKNCSNMVHADLSFLDTTKCKAFSGVFNGCTSLARIDVGERVVFGSSPFLAPSLPGATGNWVNLKSKVVYAPSKIPSGVKASYTAERQSGTWQQDAGGIWYRFPDGSWAANEWLNIDATWYHFKDDGYVSTKWEYVFDDRFETAGSTWYYFDPNGLLVCGEWIADSKGWCFTDPATGAMWVNRWASDSVGPCYIGPEGYCLTGWLLLDDAAGESSLPGWYYADLDGRIKRGHWIPDSKGWCYTDPKSGVMWVNRWARDSVAPCYIGGEGYCLTGWFLADSDFEGNSTPNTWYYADADGRLKCDEWIEDSQGWCYVDAQVGQLWVNKWVKDSVGWCFVGPDGHCVTGAYRVNTAAGQIGNPGAGTYSFDQAGRIISL